MPVCLSVHHNVIKLITPLISTVGPVLSQQTFWQNTDLQWLFVIIAVWQIEMTVNTDYRCSFWINLEKFLCDTFTYSFCAKTALLD